ncbi:MAG TPA: hypothetical protein VF364_07365 [Candidatus Limnocylindria bacterium]
MVRAGYADEPPAHEVARVALARSLFLQREIRRAARSRSNEAAVSLSRSALESCFLGLYCLFDPDAEEQVDRAVARSLKVVLAAPVAPFMSHEELGAALREQFGSDRPLDVWSMIDKTVKAGGPEQLVPLYRTFYDPTSNLYVHASPLGLHRHRRRLADHPRVRPRPLIGTRTAVHIGDVSVGLLAGEIARAGGRDAGEFESYFDVHRDRMWSALPRFILMMPIRLGVLSPLRGAVAAQRDAARRGDDWVPLEEADALIDQVAGRLPGNIAIERVVEHAKRSVRRARQE